MLSSLRFQVFLLFKDFGISPSALFFFRFFFDWNLNQRNAVLAKSVIQSHFLRSAKVGESRPVNLWLDVTNRNLSHVMHRGGSLSYDMSEQVKHLEYWTKSPRLCPWNEHSSSLVCKPSPQSIFPCSRPSGWSSPVPSWPPSPAWPRPMRNYSSERRRTPSRRRR